jgi:hypothetical protein
MRRIALAGVLVVLVGASALAQRGGNRFTFSNYTEPANPRYDGRFMFNRLKFTVAPGGFYYRGLPAWAHGEPFADENLMKIMDAVSMLKPHIEQGVVMGFDNPELFKFPVAYMAEAGYWIMSDEEGQVLREYMQKGGFVIFDDFRDGRGNAGWDNFSYNMRRVLPGVEFVPMDINHPIFHSFYEINSFDVVPQAYDNFTRPSFAGIFEDNDRTKRLMAIINFNTDLADFWEFSGQGIYPIDEANEAYKLGVNYIIYGLTH